MAKMGGCNQPMQERAKNPGTHQMSRMVPGKFARNNLSKGGVNKMMLGKYPDPETHKGGK